MLSLAAPSAASPGSNKHARSLYKLPSSRISSIAASQARLVPAHAGCSLRNTSAPSACRQNTSKVIAKTHRSVLVRAGMDPSNTPVKGKVLLIGVTGVTGRSALSGLLAGGLQPEQLLAVSRNPQGSAAQAVAAQGIQVVAADLDKPETLQPHLEGIRLVYCHALSGDSATADPQELARAKTLAQVLAGHKGLELLVYNSSAGRGSNSGITQMEQKHAVEDIFMSAGLPLLALGATMFMEEFWKKYTRPSVVEKGVFPFSIPGDRPLQLVAARDMGLAAAIAMRDPGRYGGRGHLPLAGDELTPLEMCREFSRAQGGREVKHNSPPAWIFWILSRDLWRIIQFLKNTGYTADVSACRQQFPGMITFQQFLDASGWGDAGKTYEQGISFGVTPAAAAAGGAGAGAKV